MIKFQWIKRRPIRSSLIIGIVFGFFVLVFGAYEYFFFAKQHSTWDGRTIHIVVDECRTKYLREIQELKQKIELSNNKSKEQEYRKQLKKVELERENECNN